MISSSQDQLTMVKVVFLPWWPWVLVIPNSWVV